MGQQKNSKKTQKRKKTRKTIKTVADPKKSFLSVPYSGAGRDAAGKTVVLLDVALHLRGSSANSV
jgi:hypothetical protein